MQSFYESAEKRTARQRRTPLDRRYGLDRRLLSASWEAFEGLRSGTELERRATSGRRALSSRRLNERRM